MGGCAYRDDGYACFVAEPVHLTLLLAVQQVVPVLLTLARENPTERLGTGTYLHRDKLRPPVLLRAELHHGKLVCPHGRSTNVSNLTRRNEVVESAHGLLDGRVLVEAVDPEEIDVVRFQALERVIYRGKKCLPREAFSLPLVFVL